MQAGVCPGVCSACAAMSPAEPVAIGEQPVELAAVALELRAGVEDLAEHFLHDGDVAADRQHAAELLLEIGRGRQMVGMHMGLEQPFHLEPVFVHKGDQPVGGPAFGAAGGRIEVQHGIDERALAGGGVGRDIAHRIGRLVEKARDLGRRIAPVRDAVR